MTTEGTYPFVVGGVSTWCHQLISGMTDRRWQILAIAGSDCPKPCFVLPSHASLVGRIEPWSEAPSGWRPPARGVRSDRHSLPAELATALVGWAANSGPLLEALTWCRLHPHRVRSVFRSRRAWASYLSTLQVTLDECAAGVGAVTAIDLHHAGRLYQALYWVSQVAALPTPATDLLLVTAAGWAGVPALVHRSLHGTPLLLAEHGVYVREAYLAEIRADRCPAARLIATRLAAGLARAVYANADMVAPVCRANASWEKALGVAPERIRVIPNAIRAQPDPPPAPGTGTVMAVGRLDPLKDVHTMLSVAAEVVRRVPDARFVHYGPVPVGQEAYGRSCLALHAELGLGDRFRFMGSTGDPIGVLRDADVVLLTSISEGFPISVLEAMSQARPVVATSVGGVPEAVLGCGMLAAPGNAHDLAMGVVTLLRQPALAQALGRRGHRRVTELFDESVWLHDYRSLLDDLTARVPAP